MNIKIFLLPFFLLLIYYSFSQRLYREATEPCKPNTNPKINVGVSKYDTLIPIFGHLFITYDKIDSNNFIRYSKKYNGKERLSLYDQKGISFSTRKWGIVDTLGNIVVPFICDGVKALSDTVGIISIYSNSHSLNTGVPRYMYQGITYYFDKNGILNDTEKEFSIVIMGLSDWHFPEFVINYGHEFYLPNR